MGGQLRPVDGLPADPGPLSEPKLRQAALMTEIPNPSPDTPALGEHPVRERITGHRTNLGATRS